MANIGDRVLICDGFWEAKVLNGTFKPQYGTVEKKYLSEDRSHHGSPIYDAITVVRGDDGSTYTNDPEQIYSKDWRTTKRFFTEQELAGVIMRVVRDKEKVIDDTTRDIKTLKTQLSLFQKAPLNEKIQSASNRSAGSHFTDKIITTGSVPER